MASSDAAEVALRQRLEAAFPGLRSTPYEIISSGPEVAYNCIAWAAGDITQPWWPVDDAQYWWPLAPRQETVDDFVRMFQTLGFELCVGSEPEPDFEKVAIYALPTDDPDADEPIRPTHAARQLLDGRWTSKLGASALIAHTLVALEGGQYGMVVQVMRRRLDRP